MADDPEGTEPASQPTEPEPTSTEPERPEYQDILESLPESLHSIVTPEIEKFSESQKAKIKEYEEKLSPWSEVVEQYEPSDAQKRLEFAKAFEANPVQVYNDLYKYLSDNNMLPQEVQPAQPATEPEGEDDDDDDIDDPAYQSLNKKFEGLQEAVTKIVENLQGQQKAQQETQMKSQLENHLGEIEKEYPNTPRNYLLKSIANGEDGFEAAKSFKEQVESQVQAKLQPGEEAPTVIGSGGAPPSNRIDPKQARSTREGRQELAMQILKQQQE